MLASASLERLTLLLNHVIAAEPAAVARLRSHSGATLRVRVSGWPSLLPTVPDAAFRVTPAGLLEWIGPGESLIGADLEIDVEASNPLAVLGGLVTGSRPRVDVAGSAALAADVDWVIDNLRWDIQDDLARVVGPAAAHGVARLAAGASAAVAAAVRAVADVAGRARAGDPGAPPAR